MNAKTILKKLYEINAKVKVCNGDLNIEIPKGLLEEDLKLSIIKNKKEIINILEKMNSGNHFPLEGSSNSNSKKIPLSMEQMQLWLFDRSRGGQDTTYNTAFFFELTGDVDIESVEESLKKIVLRHDVLRIFFIEEDGYPYQIKNDKPIFDYKYVEEVDNLNYIDKFVSKSFDLEKGPLVRFRLLKIENNLYKLVVSIHHIISDGWSITSVFVRDFTEFYMSLVQRKEPQLPVLDVQYTDYAIWQKNNITDVHISNQKDFWLRTLEGSTLKLNLPYKNSQIAEGGSSVEEIRYEMSSDLLKNLRGLGRKQGVTLYMIFISACWILLNRYSSRNDMIFCTSTSSRKYPKLDNLIGFFIRLIPVRISANGSYTVSDLLKNAKQASLSAFENQDLSFSEIFNQIINKNKDERLDNIPILIRHQNFPQEEMDKDYAGIKINAASLVGQAFKFDLDFAFYTDNEQITLVLEYAKFKFDKNIIRNLVEQYESVLLEMTRKENIHQFEIYNERYIENYRDLGLGKKTEVQYGDSVHLLFEKVAASNPHDIAYEYQDKSINYTKLNSYANGIASCLHDKGVLVGDRVGVYFERSIDYIATILAIFKIGAIYVPLDSGYPAEYVSTIIKDADIKLIVTKNNFLFEKNKISTIYVDLLSKNYLNIKSFESFQSKKASLMPAYILYTSGTTGKPKGVLTNHYQILNNISSYWDSMPKESDDVCLQKTSVSFGPSIKEIFSGLLIGIKTVIVEDDIVNDPRLFSDFIYNKKITRVYAIPSYLETLLLHYKGVENKLSNIKYFSLGGEVLSKYLYDLTKKMLPGAQIINNYGNTELTDVTYGQENLDENTSYIPIGKPIQNIKLYVLDGNLREVPVGSVGELYVEGSGVSYGYWGRPDTTAEAYIPNPFSKSGARIYKTGDFVRYSHEGELEFIGRHDEVLKIRGARVELKQIEVFMKNLPEISNAIVKAETDSKGIKNIIAFCSLSKKIKAEIKKIEGTIANGLPAYMRPSKLIVVDNFPKLPNGKINRKSLSSDNLFFLAEENTEHPVVQEKIDLKDDIERRLAQIWSEILNTDLLNINRNSDFFELGGDSLVAMRLTSVIGSKFDFEPAVKSIFEYTNIKSYAEYIKGSKSINVDQLDLDLNIRVLKVRNNIPLSYAQKRIWFLEQYKGEGSIQYNEPYLFKFTGRLCVNSLRQAIKTIVERHESFRTRFEWKSDEPVQIIEPVGYLDLSIQEIDEVLLDNFCQEKAAIPFDLEKGPLARFYILKMSDTKFALFSCLHHIITDGWSSGIFWRELNNLYESLLNNRAQNLEPVTYQYIDYSEWQRNWLKAGKLEEQLVFWKDCLSDAPPLLEIPTDKPRPEFKSYKGDSIEFFLDSDTENHIKKICADYNITIFMYFLGAFKLLLHKYSGKSDILIGTTVANRSSKNIQNIIGCFINTLVLRSNIKQDQTLLDFLLKLKETCLNAYANENLPFEYLVEELNPERRLDYSPIFQVLFICQNFSFDHLSLPNIDVSEGRINTDTSRYDLTLEIIDTGKGFLCKIEYDTDLFYEKTIRNLFNVYDNTLKFLSDNIYKKIASLSLLSKKDTEFLYPCNFNPDYRENISSFFPGLFKNIVSVNKDSIAVFCDQESMTYSQLHTLSNQLAHGLLNKGLKHGECVGAYLEKDINSVFILLGIIKAGCCYVPLDPKFPSERLLLISKNASLRVIVKPEICEVPHELSGIEIFEISDNNSNLTEYPENEPTVHLHRNSCVYAMYTSGSTGKPKGIKITHENLLNFLVSAKDELKINNRSRFLSVTSLGFDISCLEIFLPLIAGAQVHIASSEQAIDGHALQILIENNDISYLQGTPATWRLLIDSGWQGKRDLIALCGGEAWSSDLLLILKKLVAEIWNMYGPTETTIWSAANKFAPDAEEVLIHNSLANTHLLLLDDNFNPVPPGFIGQICIAGKGLAPGYVDDPSLTAEKFIPNPFSSFGWGDRIYCTGDLGKINSNGEIEFLERIDHQVKIRGYRIECKEIETLLNQHPLIDQSIVQTYIDNLGSKELIAYVKPVKEISKQDISLFFSISSEDSEHNKIYDFFIKNAKKADELGLSAIWIPGKLFNTSNSSYSNPSVLSSALAMMTKDIDLRAANILPSLHEPIEIAKEWSVIDNLSNGRIGLSFISDFDYFNPELKDYKNKKDILFNNIKKIKTLWNQGGMDNKNMGFQLNRTQENLPIWLSCSADPEMFYEAGVLGINILTHLMLQDIDSLADKILIYRNSLKKHGHEPESYKVSLIVHACLFDDESSDSEHIKEALSKYFKSNSDFLKSLIKVYGAGLEGDTEREFIDKVIKRYIDISSLIGSTKKCTKIYKKIKDSGVDELICSIDFSIGEGLLPEGIEKIRKIAGGDNSNLDFNDLKRYLENKLPSYMIPSQFNLIKDIPLNENRKIDRSSLPKPTYELVESKISLNHTSINNQVEDKLIQIWGEILKLSIDFIKNTDNFFNLGGSSLSATRLVSRINDKFLIKISVKAVFEYPVLKDMALYLERIGKEAEKKTYKKRDNSAAQKITDLSFGQKRLWFLDKYSDESHEAYSDDIALSITGSIDIHILEKSFLEVIKRHESLRSHFDLIDEIPKQFIKSDFQFKVEFLSVSSQEYSRILNSKINKPFDLKKSPLLRACLLKLEKDKSVLLIGFHHIIFDGWSIGILLEDLFSIYSSIIEDKNYFLDEIKYQYQDYILDQRNFVKSELYKSKINYWINKLKGASPYLNMPYDFTRPSRQSYYGLSKNIELPIDIKKKLQKISDNENVTLFTLLFSFFSLLIWRVSGVSDILIGTPVANRQTSDMEKIIGFFANTIVLRSKIDPLVSLGDYLKDQQENILSALDNQEVPFSSLVEKINPDRNPSYSPLFQVMFVFQNTPFDLRVSKNLEINWLKIEKKSSKFDLLMQVVDMPNGLSCTIEYNENLFTAKRIQFFAEQYGEMLNSSTDYISLPLRKIPYFTNEQHKWLIDVSSGQYRDIQKNPTVVGLIEDIVLDNNNSIAIIDGNERYSYSEVNSRANQIAHFLLKKGVKRGECVAVLTERSANMVFVLLGILKIGACYTPLEDDLPLDRIKYILKDCSVKVFLYSENINNNFRNSDFSADVFKISNIFLDCENNNLNNPNVKISNQDIFNIIYTSGSTGAPKGVICSHIGIFNRLVWMKEYLSITKREIILQKTSYSFDVSVWEIFLPLIVGAKLVLAAPHKQRYPEYLQKIINIENISVMHFVPSMLNAFIDVIYFDSFPSLKKIICSGEELKYETQLKFIELFNHVKLYNFYGPTEASIDVSAWQCGEYHSKKTSIGMPIDNCNLYVFNNDFELTPPGSIGELYIGGISLAYGYLNQPNLTAEKFLPDPFSTGRRLYKTGDIVKRDLNGQLEFIGRSDHQVKIRGHRIECGEIENVIVSINSVKAAAVLAKYNKYAKTNMLVAYIESAGKSSEDEIKSFLKEKLPLYMIPSIINFLKEVPVNANGKIDYQKLSNYEYKINKESLEEKSEISDTAYSIKKIFSEVLGTNFDEISYSDSFFDIGGDSILSLQVISNAKKRGFDIKPWQIFEYSTALGLAEKLDKDEIEDNILKEKKSSNKKSILSPIQMQFFELNFYNNNHYNQSILFDLSEKISMDFFENALKVIIDSHPALRMRYFMDGSLNWMQSVINENFDSSCIYIDLEDYNGALEQGLFYEYSKKSQAGFNIKEGKLIEVLVFHYRGHAKKLLISCHHLAIDAISWRILLEDIEALYACFQNKLKLELLPEHSSYTDWIDYLHKQAKSKSLNKSSFFWKQFKNTKTEGIPVDVKGYTEDKNTYSSAERVSRSAKLNNKIFILKMDIQKILLTAFFQTLHYWTKNENIVIELEDHGRDFLSKDLDLSRTIGWFTACYPVIIKLPGNYNYKEDYKIVSKKIDEFFMHGKNYNLLKYYNKEENFIPQPNVIFNYLGREKYNKAKILTASESEIPELVSAYNLRRHLLEVNLMIVDDNINIDFWYSKNAHSLNTINVLIDNYIKRIENFIENL